MWKLTICADQINSICACFKNGPNDRNASGRLGSNQEKFLNGGERGEEKLQGLA